MLFKIEKQEYKVELYKDYCDYFPTTETKSYDTPFFFNVEEVYKVYDEYQLLETKYCEQEYVKNYGNLLAECSLRHLKVYVKKEDDKIKLVTKYFSKTRMKGRRPFNKHTKIFYLSYDLKHNNLYIGTIDDSHRKGKKYYRTHKNDFFVKPLKTWLESTKSYLKIFKTNNFEEMEKDGFDLAKCIDIFLENIPGTDDNTLSKEDILYKKFLELNNVKLPNNWNKFSRSFPQISKKIYKKNKHKFVDSYMELHNLRGDKIKRILHIVDSTDGITYLKFALYFFGDDFMLSQSDEFIKSVIESKSYSGVVPTDPIHRRSSDGYTKNEKKNAFEIFKLILNHKINFLSYVDHIQFKEQLKVFEPKQWKSKNYFEFMNEHYDWSEKIKNFNKSHYTRFYNDKFKLIMEEPIEDYYPILLTTTKEYNFESMVQSNCVRTYDNKPESVIFSLRHKEIDGGRRATIEYRIVEIDDRINLTRVQTLGKFNERLSDEWKPILQQFDERIKFCCDNEIFQLPNVQIKYNNTIIDTKIMFKDVKSDPSLHIFYGVKRDKLNLKQLVFENTIEENINYENTPF